MFVGTPYLVSCPVPVSSIWLLEVGGERVAMILELDTVEYDTIS